MPFHYHKSINLNFNLLNKVMWISLKVMPNRAMTLNNKVLAPISLLIL